MLRGLSRNFFSMFSNARFRLSELKRFRASMSKTASIEILLC